MAAAPSIVCILFKDKKGWGPPDKKGENPWECKVDKGELLIEIPERERFLAEGKGKLPHNYRLYSDPDRVTLYASPAEAMPLREEELVYLLAVTPPSLRVLTYLNTRKLKEKMELVKDDVVTFKMKLIPKGPDIYINGVIRYIGPLEETPGMFFGIEILEEKWFGKGTTNGRPYFTCGTNNGVFVSMDKIIQKSHYSQKPQKQSSKTDTRDINVPKSTDQVITSQPTATNDLSGGPPAANTRGQMAKFGTKVKNIITNQFTQSPSAEVDDTDVSYQHQSEFKPGHRVVLQSVRGTVIHGTVRWVGSVRVSPDRSMASVPVVGVETDKSINPKEDFPELHVYVTDSNGQELFQVAPNHGRVYLPESLVVHADEFKRQQENDGSNQMEQKLAKELGLTVEEYRAQQEYLDKANAKRDMSDYHRKARDDPRIGEEGHGDEEGRMFGAGQFGGGERGGAVETGQVSDRQFKEQQEALKQFEKKQRERRNLQQQDQSHDYQVIDGEIKESEEDSYVQLTPYALSQQGDNSGCGHNSPHLRTVKEDHPLGSVSTALPQSTHSPRPHHTHYNDDHNGPTSLPPTSTNAPPPAPPTDPLTQFSIGSLVTVAQHGPPLHGVIRWIGTLPDCKGTVAGVELDEPLPGCTDGTWQRIRFFYCQPERGFFCPLQALQLDRNYIMNRTNIDDTFIDELQAEKKAIEEEKKSLEILNEQITTENKSLKREKEQLQRERYELQGDKLQLHKEKRQVEEEKRQLEEENKQLQVDKQHLTVANRDLEQEMTEKDNTHAQIQSRRAQLEIDNMRLKGQIRQLEESSVSDIKYWEISYKQVTTNGVELGRGGWGKVLVGLVNGQKVAIKMLYSDIVSPHYDDLVRREISMMAKIRHPNLMLFMGGVLDHPSGSPIIITELLDTSLRKAYKDGLLLNDTVRLSIMRDVASALNYLHCHREQIIHRDVSSANVLLEVKGRGNWKGKLSDFGSANLMQYSMTAAPGAVVYAAPEVPQLQTTKMDVYSYGILLCEVMTNQFPMPEAFPMMLQSLASIQWVHAIITVCTRRTHTDRPDMNYVLRTFDERCPDAAGKVNFADFKPLPDQN